MNSKVKSNIHYITVGSFYLLQGLIFASWSSRIPEIKTTLAINDAQLGTILLAIPLGQLISMAPAVWIIKRLSSKITLLITSVLNPLSLFAISLVQNTYQLAIVFAMVGIVSNINNICINTQGVNLERNYNSTFMPVLHGLWSMGSFLGASICMLALNTNQSIQIHFASVAIASCIVLLMLNNKLIASDASDNTETKKKSFFKNLSPYIILLGLISLSSMMCEGMMFDWSGVYFKDIVLAPENLIVLGYVAVMGCMTLARFITFLFIRKMGKVNVLKMNGMLITVGLLIAVACPNIILTTIAFGIVGVGISSVIPICYSLAGKTKSLSPAGAIASVSTIGYFGFLFSPPIVGFISQASSLRITFGIMSAVAICITILAIRLNHYQS